MWWYRNDIDSFIAHILYEDITIYYCILYKHIYEDIKMM